MAHANPAAQKSAGTCQKRREAGNYRRSGRRSPCGGGWVASGKPV